MNVASIFLFVVWFEILITVIGNLLDDRESLELDEGRLDLLPRLLLD